MIHFTSDQHFGDERCLTFCNRDFLTVRDMDITMQNKWKERVHPEDTVYHLGDLMTQKDPVEKVIEIYRELPGHKILIKGNHDEYLDNTRLLEAFEEVHDDPILITEGDERFWLCHYPVQRSDRFYTLTGHIHHHWRVQMRMLNVGVDQHNYGPVSMTSVLKLKSAEDEGIWDANVYPDAPFYWKWNQSNRRPRSGNADPTLQILRSESDFSPNNELFKQEWSDLAVESEMEIKNDIEMGTNQSEWTNGSS